MQTFVRGAMPAPQPVERRAETRMTFNLAVTVEVDGCATPAIARDLSVSGAFIECPRVRAEGQRLRLRFPVEGLPAGVGAEVQWVMRGSSGEPIGAGVRLDPMGPQETAIWTRYVRSLW